MRLPCVFGLAPLAGYTDPVFRKIAYEYGACFAYTEMISAASVFKSPQTVEGMLPLPEEPFTAVQLLGNDPDTVLRAALKLQRSGAWVDINAGCPVKKVVRKRMGGALLRDLDLLVRIVKVLKENLEVPISVKTRLGWDANEFEKIYRSLVDAGVDMVAVHARTVKQGFKGRADWKTVSLKDRPVPLLLSGDIFKPEDALKALEVSGADGILVARGAIGNPWIFSQIKNLLEKGEYTEPTFEERLSVFMEHLHEKVKLHGEKKGIVEMRKFVSGYTKGIPFASEFRAKFMKVEDLESAEKLVKEYMSHLVKSTARFHLHSGTVSKTMEK